MGCFFFIVISFSIAKKVKCSPMGNFLLKKK